MGSDVAGSPARGRRVARWRAATLVGVYVLMVAHVVHWRLAGRTLAPLELHEVMFTLELGIVTAGFLFMTLAFVATAVFGRFFCGWGCHLMGLQEACAWLLRKIRVRPRPLRSRLLAWVPAGVLFYMFVWPQLVRVVQGRPMPSPRFSSDADGIGSFVTTDFWRNLPGPTVTTLTFLVCGFLVVYLLGSRAFCAYGCPYGVLFRLADRLAPGRIRVDDRCVQCGTCTKTCTSGVHVHEEVRNFGMVVDSRCMKDLDCVHACPEGALSYRFGRPGWAKPAARGAPVRRETDFSWGEEIGMGIVFLGTLLAFRGLYNELPFLFSVGLGSAAAAAAVVAFRLVRRRRVTLLRWTLKEDGRLRRPGWAFAVAGGLFALLAAHSALVQWHKWRGRVAFENARPIAWAARADPWGGKATPAGWSADADRAVFHYEAAESLGLLPTVEARIRLAWLRGLRGEIGVAEERLRGAIELDPEHVEGNLSLGELLARRGAYAEARPHLESAVRRAPRSAPARWRLGLVLLEGGERDLAAREFEEAGRLDPRYAEAARASLEGRHR